MYATIKDIFIIAFSNKYKKYFHINMYIALRYIFAYVIISIYALVKSLII